MKKISICLSLLLALLALSTSVFAREKSDLQKVYNNLTQYLYTPYFSDSSYFAEYEAEMKKTGEFLNKSDLTEDEIDLQYGNLKKAYSNLLRDVFDYSSLDRLAKDYEGLDISLFEESSWRKLSDVMDDIYSEIDAPTLFKKGTSTKESYTQDVAKFVEDFRSQFQTAFNALELKDFSEGLDQKQLEALIHYCDISTPESIMKDSSYWSPYFIQSDHAKKVVAQNNASDTELKEAAESLLSAYKMVSSDCFDLSPVKDEIERYRSLTSNQFTQASWSRYQAEINYLNSLLSKPQFLYLNNLSEETDVDALIRSFFEEKTANAAKYYEQLVKQEDINKLSALCNTYHNTTASVGLDLKLQTLLDAVDSGYTVLKNADASGKEVTTAIDAIENAAKDLDLAESYLVEEQTKNTTNDVETIQTIIILTALTLLLSLLFACILSYRQFGRLNWYR